MFSILVLILIRHATLDILTIIHIFLLTIPIILSTNHSMLYIQLELYSFRLYEFRNLPSFVHLLISTTIIKTLSFLLDVYILYPMLIKLLVTILNERLKYLVLTTIFGMHYLSLWWMKQILVEGIFIFSFKPQIIIAGFMLNVWYMKISKMSFFIKWELILKENEVKRLTYIICNLECR